MYLMPLNYTLQNGYDGKVCDIYFTAVFFFKQSYHDITSSLKINDL